jgi:predicted nucleic acid-binding protein
VTSADTSVTVAAFASWHEDHRLALEALSRGVRLIGHVALETYAVLTRLPAPHRVRPELVTEYLTRSFAGPLLLLSAREHRRLLSSVSSARITGGAVYDALIAATALASGETLLTLDRRALSTYELIGARVRLLDGRFGGRRG